MMNRIRTLLLLLVVVILGACNEQPQPTADTKNVPPTATSVNSEESKPGADRPEFDPYFVESSDESSEIGPQVITRKILQDSQGRFWLATWNGLVRYDGKVFANVTNKDGLRRNRVFSLLEDHKKNIWIGTLGAGVYQYDGANFTQYTTKDGLVDDVVLSMIQDRENNLWFGSMGATKYDGRTFTSFTKKDGFTDADVNAISTSPDGSIWFGTRGALFRYDGESFVNFTEQHGLEIGSYIPMLFDRQGHLWFNGVNGLYHFDGETLRHLFKLTSFSLMEDSKGNIWFSGGPMDGEESEPKPGTSVLNRFDPAAGLENILVERKQFEVEAEMIFELTEDREGNIWFGSSRGIGRIAGDTIHYY